MHQTPSGSTSHRLVGVRARFKISKITVRIHGSVSAGRSFESVGANVATAANVWRGTAEGVQGIRAERRRKPGTDGGRGNAVVVVLLRVGIGIQSPLDQQV